MVFGRRAGKCAADYAKESPNPQISNNVTQQDRNLVSSIFNRKGNGDTVAGIRLHMGKTMNRHLSVFRDHEGMETAEKVIKNLKDRAQEVAIGHKGRVFNTGVIAAIELEFMLDCAHTIITGAMTRKESRGAHFRTDYLERDDEHWLTHILQYPTSEGSPEVDYLPVRITQWEPQTRVY